MTRLVVLARCFFVLATTTPAARAQSEEFGENPIADLFAALTTLTLTDEISGGSFRVDNGTEISDDTRFSVIRLPWRTDIDTGSKVGTLRVEGVVGILWADDFTAVDTASGRATVEEDWLAVGGQFGLGWSFPLWSRWRIRPGIAAALSRLENDAKFNAAAEIEIAPQIDETLVNWNAWAFTTSASLTLEWPREEHVLAYGFTSRYAIAETEVFDASTENLEGHDSTRFAVFRADVGGPTRITTHGERWAWDAFGGWVGLFDIDREALGFDDFFEIGAGLTAHPVRSLPLVRVGAGWMFGPDITGWTLGVSIDL